MYLKAKRIDDGAGFPVEVYDSEAPCSFQEQADVGSVIQLRFIKGLIGHRAWIPPAFGFHPYLLQKMSNIFLSPQNIITL